MGNTRVRARLSRTLSILTLAAALAAGPIFVAPAEPAAAASAFTHVATDRALTGETPSPHTEVSDSTGLTPAHLAIGGLSAVLLLAVMGGLVLDVRRRRPSRRHRMPGV
ncbi:hypothetical protein ACIQTT_10285 [Microbacterium sp. NPDC090225]|uniref:hypothetical protein n=1 Tax=Microbacterium sp. NPDC090225 TaxID=3364207 RepID=UPI003802E62B